MSHIFQESPRIHNGKSLFLSNGPVGAAPDGALELSPTDFTVGAKAAETSGLALHTQVGSAGAVGTDKAGANTIVKPGASSGAGVPGITKIQRGISGSAGATQNGVTDGLLLPPRKAVAANNTIQGLFEVALPAGKGASGQIRYAVFASDGTEVQIRRGLASFSVVNKAGTYTSEIAVVNEAASVSAGTLTCSWAILNGTNKVTIRFTANSSLTPTIEHITFTIENNSEQDITIL